MSPFEHPQVAKLLDGYPLAHLDAGRPRNEVASTLKDLNVESLFAPSQVRDRTMAKCCLSGLWLWHNHLDASHTISQEIETSAGSAWHGLMHRREGDYWNANYWFNRVRDASLFAGVRDQLTAEQIASLPPSLQTLVNAELWQPKKFTDEVERIVARGDAKEISAALIVATAEWRALFANCWNAAL
jgi:hypothetical protein